MSSTKRVDGASVPTGTVKRLLDELSVANEKQSQAEEKLKLAEDRHKTTHMMAQRLNTMRQDEKAMRETLVYAAREVNAEGNEGMRLPDQFSSVLQVYQRVHNDVALITNSLDAAMAEAEITSLENANLSSKMQVLLSKYRSLRQESVSMQATLDWALQSVSLKTSESATLEKKLKHLQSLMLGAGAFGVGVSTGVGGRRSLGSAGLPAVPVPHTAESPPLYDALADDVEALARLVLSASHSI